MITAVDILSRRLRELQKLEEYKEQSLKENENACHILSEELISTRETIREIVKGIKKLNESD